MAFELGPLPYTGHIRQDITWQAAFPFSLPPSEDNYNSLALLMPINTPTSNQDLDGGNFVNLFSDAAFPHDLHPYHHHHQEEEEEDEDSKYTTSLTIQDDITTSYEPCMDDVPAAAVVAAAMTTTTTITHHASETATTTTIPPSPPTTRARAKVGR